MSVHINQLLCCQMSKLLQCLKCLSFKGSSWPFIYQSHKWCFARLYQIDKNSFLQEQLIVKTVLNWLVTKAKKLTSKVSETDYILPICKNVLRLTG